MSNLLDRSLTVWRRHLFAFRALCVLFVLGYVQSSGPLVAQEKSVDELLSDLGQPRTQLRAVEALTQRPTIEVLAPLLQAMATDRELMGNARSRRGAYDVLTKLGTREVDGRLAIDDAAQVSQLELGLGDEDAGIRRICCQAAAQITARHHQELLPNLRGALMDERADVAAAAARAIGAYGAAGKEALTDLFTLLDDPQPERRARWQEQDEARRHSTTWEVFARAAAADARLILLGIGADIDLYRLLDVAGQEAAILALSPHVLNAVWSQRIPSLARAEDSLLLTDMETQVDVSSWLGEMMRVAGLAEQARVSALGALGEIAMEPLMSQSARDMATAAINAARSDASATIRSQAVALAELLALSGGN